MTYHWRYGQNLISWVIISIARGGLFRLGSMQSVIACICWSSRKRAIAFLCALFFRFYFQRIQSMFQRFNLNTLKDRYPRPEQILLTVKRGAHTMTESVYTLARHDWTNSAEPNTNHRGQDSRDWNYYYARITMITVMKDQHRGNALSERFIRDAQNWDIMTFSVFFVCFLYICFNIRVIYWCLWRFCIRPTIFYLHCIARFVEKDIWDINRFRGVLRPRF